ncbi:hypothetical protein ABZ446_40165 [Streptomyces sp. NPDC005813]|uniref:hypothetical protein n=1 Tax=Streptomyces sp. NPDC005813 TaxID=3155592 RepID=UPI0033D03DBA
MRGKGIRYDTGTLPNGDTSRPVFDADIVESDMRVIAAALHCTTIRITGGDPDRIETAARHASAAGLEVWFSPFPCEMTDEEMLPFFADCAERGERLRREGAGVLLVTGCELSLFARGYLPGDTFNDRIPVLAGPDREAALKQIPGKVNAFLDPDGVTSKPDLLRDEGEQVRCLDDLMAVFEDEGVDSVFWFTFAGYGTPHRVNRPAPDLASYGIVKILDGKSDYPRETRTYPDMPWEPRKRSARSPTTTGHSTGTGPRQRRDVAVRRGRRRHAGSSALRRPGGFRPR